MTPLEKASQLIVDYQTTVTSLDYNEAVQCSMRTVDVIIWEIIKYADNSRQYVVDNIKYWQEVKELLEKQLTTKMTLRHALLILESHQKWRSGDEFTQATEPKVLTEAINTILEYHIGNCTALMDQFPSDEEIIIQSKSFYVNDVDDYEEGFIDGAQWMRDKIKGGSNE